MRQERSRSHVFFSASGRIGQVPISDGFDVYLLGKAAEMKKAIQIVCVAVVVVGFGSAAWAGPFDVETKLTASGAESSDWFGRSVAISDSTAIVGAARDGSGSAYLFDVATGDQLHELIGDDTVSGDWFGCVVGISGNTAIVGAYADNGNSGSAYLFDVTTGDQLHKLTADDAATQDFFGYSVSISGNTAIVGAYGDDGGAGSAYNNSGAAYLFDVTTGDQLHKLTADDAASDDHFGSVAINGNTAVVGARGDDTESGSAYLFDVTTGDQLRKLTADDATVHDNFGHSVSLSGNTAIVGSEGADGEEDSSGAAYLFDVATGDQLYKLTADDAAAYAGFGEGVVIDGNTAIIGAEGDDGGLGSAYLFDVTTGDQLRKFTASDGVVLDYFGSVGLSGNTAIVGARGNANNSGAAYLFTPEPATLSMLALVGLAMIRRRSRR